MSRLFAVFALMFAFMISASAATALDTSDSFKTCLVMADEKKDGEKESEEEAEPECD